MQNTHLDDTRFKKQNTRHIHNKVFPAEASGGIILMFAAVLALLLANSSLHSYYALLIDTPAEIRIGAFEIAKPLLLWINDGLMAVFFFLVGLEPADHRSSGDTQPRSDLGLVQTRGEQLTCQDDFGHLSHLHSFSWSVTFLSDIQRRLDLTP